MSFRDTVQRIETRRNTNEAKGVPALKRLVSIARGDSGQCRHVRHFLLALYNGREWPLDVSRLRAVDVEIQDDMLAVLAMDMSPRKEVHRYVEDGDDVFRWMWKHEKAGEQAS